MHAPAPNGPAGGPGCGGHVVPPPQGRCGGCFGCSEREEPVRGSYFCFVLMGTVALFKSGSLDFTMYCKRHEKLLGTCEAAPLPPPPGPAARVRRRFGTSSDDDRPALSGGAARMPSAGAAHVNASSLRNNCPAFLKLNMKLTLEATKPSVILLTHWWSLASCRQRLSHIKGSVRGQPRPPPQRPHGSAHTWCTASPPRCSGEEMGRGLVPSG